MKSLAESLNIKNVEDYNDLAERTIEFNNKLEQRSDELREQATEIMNNLQQNPSNKDLFIDYTIVSDGAIKLLEMRSNNTRMVNQIATEIKSL